MPGTARYLYAGGNSALGFFSYFDHVTVGDATRLWVIKGGPGVGKSTFVRKIGEEMRARGFDVEYFRCSSDNDSLDGVRIPALEIALVDGTAPHVIEPKLPGAVDEILDLGDYWDEAGIRRRRDDIITMTAEVSRHFTRAYRFLAAAKLVYDDIAVAHAEGFNFGAANQVTHSLIEAIFGDHPVSPQAGVERHLFASAITPAGPENHLDTLVAPMPKKWIVTGEPGTGKSTMLAKIARASIERGLYTEVFHCALNPVAIDHVLIPQLGAAVVTSAKPHTYEVPDANQVNMNPLRSEKALEKTAPIVAANEKLYEELFERAVSFLAEAKDDYQILESYYVKHMDFHRVESVRKRTVKRILRYAKELGVG